SLRAAMSTMDSINRLILFSSHTLYQMEASPDFHPQTLEVWYQQQGKMMTQVIRWSRMIGGMLTKSRNNFPLLNNIWIVGNEYTIVNLVVPVSCHSAHLLEECFEGNIISRIARRKTIRNTEEPLRVVLK